MLENQIISASMSSSPFDWNPSTVFQTTLLTASLLTFLSYQGTSVLYDLLLGLKPRHSATASSIHSLLLTDESSPLSIVAAIFRKDALDQLRFGLPQHTKFIRTPQAITRGRLVCFLLLLVSGPLVNVIAVTLALEFDKVITFAEGDVKLALGVANNSMRLHEYINSCMRFEDSFKGDVTAQFFNCVGGATSNSLAEPSTASKVRVVVAQGEVRAELFSKGANFSASTGRYFDVSVSPKVYRLSHAVDAKSARALANRVKIIVENLCDQEDGGTLATSGQPSLRQAMESSDRQVVDQLTVPKVVVEVDHACDNLQSFEKMVPLIGATASVLKNMTSLVEVEDFLVTDATEINQNLNASPTWIRGEDLTLIRARKPVVPVLWITVAVGAVLIIRVFLKLFTYNDVYDGIEAVVASGLGFVDGYEVIRCNEVIRYDHKLQRGEEVHYGAARAGWVEVGEFDRSVGTLKRNEESYYDGKVNSKLDDDDSGDAYSA